MTQCRGTADLTTWHLAYPLRVLLHVLLPPAPGMTRTYQLGMVFKARRNGLRAVCIPFHEFHHLLFLFLLPPSLERVHALEHKGISVINISASVWGFLEPIGDRFQVKALNNSRCRSKWLGVTQGLGQRRVGRGASGRSWRVYRVGDNMLRGRDRLYSEVLEAHVRRREGQFTGVLSRLQASISSGGRAVQSLCSTVRLWEAMSRVCHVTANVLRR